MHKYKVGDIVYTAMSKRCTGHKIKEIAYGLIYINSARTKTISYITYPFEMENCFYITIENEIVLKTGNRLTERINAWLR